MSRASPRYKRKNPALPAIQAGHHAFRVTVVGLLEGQMTINTFIYDNNVNVPTAADLSVFEAAWRANLWTDYLACLSSDWTAQYIKVDVIDIPSLAPFYNYVVGTTPGTGPAGHLATTDAAVIHRQTGIKGQHGRGRIYLPAVPSAWVSGSTITNTAKYNVFAVDVFLAFANGAYNALAALYAKPGTGPTQLQTVPGLGILVSAGLVKTLCTVRRRRLGRGK